MKNKKTAFCWLLAVCIYCLLIPATAQSPKDSVRYWKAITEAMSPNPSKISGDLVPVTKDNKNLVWKVIDGEDYLLVVTWKQSVKYYEPYIDSAYYSTGPYEIWITTAPQLLDKFKGSKKTDTSMRLKQMLGLPPNSVYNYFVTFWVRPQDLFRPCADNEIADGTCGLCFPVGTDTAYQAWINGNRISRYYPCALYDKYPWTQLGYTYDWNPKNKTHVGLSEFVIRKNSKVIVQAIYTTAQYLNRQPPMKERLVKLASAQ